MRSTARIKDLEDPLEVSYGVAESDRGSDNGGNNNNTNSSEGEIFTFNDEDIVERGEPALERTALNLERRAAIVPSSIRTKLSNNSIISPMYTNLPQQKSKDTNEIAFVPNNNTPRTILTLEEEEEEDSCMKHKGSYYNDTPRSHETTLNIEHNINGKRKYQNIRRFIKPVLAVVAVLTTGSVAYFFSDFFNKFLEVPGLKNQVTRLEEQNMILKQQITELEGQVSRLKNEVDELGSEVDRLGNETNRLETTNINLNETAVYYSEQNSILNGSLNEYQQLNAQLMDGTELLEEEVSILGEKLNDINLQNIRLNQTVWNLTIQVDNINTINKDLNETNVQLNIAVTEFSKETETLFATNNELNATVESLEFQIDSMNTQIDRLQNLTTNLGLIVNFINETSLINDETMDDFVQSVAESITTSRELTMKSVENMFRQKTSNWDCDFREYFITEPFVEDRKTPISSSYSDVLEYIDWQILSTMCLDTKDFELFLQDEFSQQLTASSSSLSNVITFNQITQSVGEYTDKAFEYYFVLTSQKSLDPSIWDDANYDCKNLLPSQQYRYSK